MIRSIFAKAAPMVFISTFIILFGFWISLSGRFDLFHLSLGIISCALVSFLSRDLLFSGKGGRNHLSRLLRFLRYLPWLFYQIVLANLYVAYLALHPKPTQKIDPHVIKFKTKLKTDLPLTTFANSITLTPGTITLLVQEGFFYVHAISQKVADDLLTGEMEDRVAQIYQEE
jgi:multicomponent Na+:H+ antiporter subunit E